MYMVWACFHVDIFRKSTFEIDLENKPASELISHKTFPARVIARKSPSDLKEHSSKPCAWHSKCPHCIFVAITFLPAASHWKEDHPQTFLFTSERPISIRASPRNVYRIFRVHLPRNVSISHGARKRAHKASIATIDCQNSRAILERPAPLGALGFYSLIIERRRRVFAYRIPDFRPKTRRPSSCGL